MTTYKLTRRGRIVRDIAHVVAILAAVAAVLTLALSCVAASTVDPSCDMSYGDAVNHCGAITGGHHGPAAGR